MDKSKVYSQSTLYVNMSDRFGLRFGFLTSGYRTEFYFWEILIILRKTVLVLLITFLAPISKGVQSLSTIIVLSTFLIVHLRVSPFYDSKLNNLETYSLLALILVVYFGLYYQAGKDSAALLQSDIVKWTVFTMVFIASFAFLTHFVVQMHAEALRIAAKKKL